MRKLTPDRLLALVHQCSSTPEAGVLRVIMAFLEQLGVAQGRIDLLCVVASRNDVAALRKLMTLYPGMATPTRMLEPCEVAVREGRWDVVEAILGLVRMPRHLLERLADAGNADVPSATRALARSLLQRGIVSVHNKYTDRTRSKVVKLLFDGDAFGACLQRLEQLYESMRNIGAAVLDLELVNVREANYVNTMGGVLRHLADCPRIRAVTIENCVLPAENLADVLAGVAMRETFTALRLRGLELSANERLDVVGQLAHMPALDILDIGNNGAISAEFAGQVLDACRVAAPVCRRVVLRLADRPVDAVVQYLETRCKVTPYIGECAPSVIVQACCPIAVWSRPGLEYDWSQPSASESA